MQIYLPNTPNIIPESLSQKIEILVEEILESRKNKFQKNTFSIEREIDLLVYSLYNFNDEEIRIIDEFTGY